MNLILRARRRLARLLMPPGLPAASPPPVSFQERFAQNISAGKRTIFLPTCAYEEYPERGARVRVRIGSDCMIGARFIFESEQGTIEIGDRTFINGGTSLVARTNIRLGSDVMISWQVEIRDHDAHSLDWRARREDILRQNENYRSGIDFRSNHNWTGVGVMPIVIGDKVWVGFGSVILKGVTIGEGAIVGAHAVVTQNVEPWTIVAGNPARVVKQVPTEFISS